MALTKLTQDLNYHQGLSDKPNLNDGLTPTQVKQRYDQAANDIKTYVNNTLTPEIEAQFATKTDLENAVIGDIPVTIAAPYVGVSTNSGNNYSITSSTFTTLVEGTGIKFKCNADSTGATTLNGPWLSAKSILKQNGTAMATLKKDSIYTVAYNGVNFILQGEGGDIPKLPNLIKNGSFENGDNCYYKTGNPVIVTTDKKFGSKSMFQNSTLNGSVFYTQWANLIAGHKYYLSCWCKNLSNSTAATDFAAKGSQILFAPNSTDFIFGSVIYTATATEIVGINVGWTASVNNGLGVWTDGLMLLDLGVSGDVSYDYSKSEIDVMVQKNGGYWDSDLQSLTSDATALATDISSGKTAYINGWQIGGTSTKKNWAINTGTTNGTSLAPTVVNGLGFTPTFIFIQVTDATELGYREQFTYSANNDLYRRGTVTFTNNVYAFANNTATYQGIQYDDTRKITVGSGTFSFTSYLPSCTFKYWAFA